MFRPSSERGQMAFVHFLCWRWHICKGKLHVWTGAHPRGCTSICKAGLPKPWNPDSSSWVPDTSHGAAAGVCSPVCGLALILPLAITVTPFFPSGVGMYILNHCVLEVCDVVDCIGTYRSEILSFRRLGGSCTFYVCMSVLPICMYMHMCV